MTSADEPRSQQQQQQQQQQQHAAWEQLLVATPDRSLRKSVDANSHITNDHSSFMSSNAIPRLDKESRQGSMSTESPSSSKSSLSQQQRRVPGRHKHCLSDGGTAPNTCSDVGDGIACSPSSSASHRLKGSPKRARTSDNATTDCSATATASSSAAMCSAISNMILCCNGATEGNVSPSNAAQQQGSGRPATFADLAATLPIPAVLSNSKSVISDTFGTDLLFEEENTHGKRGIDQAKSDDMILLEEATRGARKTALGYGSGATGSSTNVSGDDRSRSLKRLGSSLAQSRAMDSGLADDDMPIINLPEGKPSTVESALEKKDDGSVQTNETAANDDASTITEKSKGRSRILKRKNSRLAKKIKTAFKRSTSKSTAGSTVRDDELRSVAESTISGDGSNGMEAYGSDCKTTANFPQNVAATQTHVRPVVSREFPLIDTSSSMDYNDVETKEDDSPQSLHLLKPPKQHIFGPPLGTFEDVCSPSDGPTTSNRKELVDTYGSYRMDQFYVQNILSNMDTVLPLFHHGRSLESSKKWDSVSDLKHMRGCCSQDYDNSDLVVRNVCSEPSASSVKVRGSKYTKDSIKVGSAESIFSLLGVDNLFNKKDDEGGFLHCSAREGSYLSRLRSVCIEAGVDVPFLLVVNFCLPWGNLLAYMYRPDGTGAGPFNANLEESVAAECLWRQFLEGDDEYRNQRLKFIPRICQGPWIVKKMVGSAPALLGQKLPTSYYGSVEDNYLEICLDVTAGPQIANTIATTVAGKSDVVTVDLAFLIEGLVDEEELPEQLFAAYRLHHVNMKRTTSEDEWIKEVKERQALRQADVDGIEML